MVRQLFEAVARKFLFRLFNRLRLRPETHRSPRVFKRVNHDLTPRNPFKHRVPIHLKSRAVGVNSAVAVYDELRRNVHHDGRTKHSGGLMHRAGVHPRVKVLLDRKFHFGGVLTQDFRQLVNAGGPLLRHRANRLGHRDFVRHSRIIRRASDYIRQKNFRMRFAKGL